MIVVNVKGSYGTKGQVYVRVCMHACVCVVCAHMCMCMCIGYKPPELAQLSTYIQPVECRWLA